MVVPLVVAEVIAAMSAAQRMLVTRGGTPVVHDRSRSVQGDIAVIVPTLNEAARVSATLASLRAYGSELSEIVVVDGGSTDGTRAVVEAATLADARIRFVDASPTPVGWNGKAWNLEVGLRATRAPWVATIDADVRIGPTLLADAVARADREELAALSIATQQELPDALSALLHPALLTTLVYRAGLPNMTTTDPLRVMANGQLFIARRRALERADAFRRARASRCEDVTIARTLAAGGERIGFFEGDAVVRMHGSWRECVANWPRSLALRDGFVSPLQLALSLAEVLLGQALPLPTLATMLLSARRKRSRRRLRTFAVALVAMRIAVLAGTRRAYVRPSHLYWLSPLADLPALALIGAAALRRRHFWRGRILVNDAA